MCKSCCNIVSFFAVVCEARWTWLHRSHCACMRAQRVPECCWAQAMHHVKPIYPWTSFLQCAGFRDTEVYTAFICFFGCKYWRSFWRIALRLTHRVFHPFISSGVRTMWDHWLVPLTESWSEDFWMQGRKMFDLSSFYWNYIYVFLLFHGILRYFQVILGNRGVFQRRILGGSKNFLVPPAVLPNFRGKPKQTDRKVEGMFRQFGFGCFQK